MAGQIGEGHLVRHCRRLDVAMLRMVVVVVMVRVEIKEHERWRGRDSL